MRLSAIIKTVDLRKAYRVGTEKVVALHCINLEIEKGQVCCILGTSGSGKSTLLNQLAGLEKPTRGEVWIKGKKISAMTEKQLAHFRQKNVGFVFQSYNLLQGMSAVENVALPLTFRGISKKKRLRLAKEMLVAVGLGKRLKHKPSEMSGGQQQRVGIARAFVAKPDVVFADEPTGNLDTKTTREVMHLFLSFARKQQITIVLVTHDQNLARYADRIVTIVDGEVIKDVLNDSLYDITLRLEEEFAGKIKENASVEALRDFLLETSDKYGDGVSAQLLEMAVTEENRQEMVELTRRMLDSEKDLQRGTMMKKIGVEAGLLDKEVPIPAEEEARVRENAQVSAAPEPVPEQENSVPPQSAEEYIPGGDKGPSLVGSGK